MLEIEALRLISRTYVLPTFAPGLKAVIDGRNEEGAAGGAIAQRRAPIGRARESPPPEKATTIGDAVDRSSLRSRASRLKPAIGS